MHGNLSFRSPDPLVALSLRMQRFPMVANQTDRNQHLYSENLAYINSHSSCILAQLLPIPCFDFAIRYPTKERPTMSRYFVDCWPLAAMVRCWFLRRLWRIGRMSMVEGGTVFYTCGNNPLSTRLDIHSCFFCCSVMRQPTFKHCRSWVSIRSCWPRNSLWSAASAKWRVSKNKIFGKMANSWVRRIWRKRTSLCASTEIS